MLTANPNSGESTITELTPIEDGASSEEGHLNSERTSVDSTRAIPNIARTTGLATAFGASLSALAFAASYKLSPNSASQFNRGLGEALEFVNGAHYSPQIGLSLMAAATVYSCSKIRSSSSDVPMVLRSETRATNELCEDKITTLTHNKKGFTNRLRMLGRMVILPLTLAGSLAMGAVNHDVVDGQTDATAAALGHMPDGYNDPSKITVITQKGGGNTFMNDSGIKEEFIPKDAVPFSKGLAEFDQGGEKYSGVVLGVPSGALDGGNVLGSLVDGTASKDPEKVSINGVDLQFGVNDPEITSMQRGSAIIGDDDFRNVFGDKRPFGAITNRELSKDELVTISSNGMQADNGQQWIDGMKGFMRNNAVSALAIGVAGLAFSSVAMARSRFSNSINSRIKEVSFLEQMGLNQSSIREAEGLGAMGAMVASSPIVYGMGKLAAKFIEATNLGIAVDINAANTVTASSLMALVAWASTRRFAGKKLSGTSTITRGKL
jgi:hypothetical protein